MKETIKRHLISALLTFLGTFIVVVCALMSSDTFVFEKTAIVASIVSGLVAGARACVKVVWEIGAYLISESKK